MKVKFGLGNWMLTIMMRDVFLAFNGIYMSDSKSWGISRFFRRATQTASNPSPTAQAENEVQELIEQDPTGLELSKRLESIIGVLNAQKDISECAVNKHLFEGKFYYSAIKALSRSDISHEALACLIMHYIFLENEWVAPCDLEKLLEEKIEKQKESIIDFEKRAEFLLPIVKLCCELSARMVNDHVKVIDITRLAKDITRLAKIDKKYERIILWAIDAVDAVADDVLKFGMYSDLLYNSCVCDSPSWYPVNGASEQILDKMLAVVEGMSSDKFADFLAQAAIDRTENFISSYINAIVIAEGGFKTHGWLPGQTIKHYLENYQRLHDSNANSDQIKKAEAGVANFLNDFDKILGDSSRAMCLLRIPFDFYIIVKEKQKCPSPASPLLTPPQSKPFVP